MSGFIRHKHNAIVRKEHSCIWCSESIPKGEKCYINVSACDGSISTNHMHNECYTAWQWVIGQNPFMQPDDFCWGYYERGGDEEK